MKRPDWTFHRMDIQRRPEKGGMAILVCMIGFLVMAAGAIGYALWGAI